MRKSKFSESQIVAYVFTPPGIDRTANGTPRP